MFNNYTQKQIAKDEGELALITHKEEQKSTLKAEFNFIDLFAGIGGVRQAFQNIGGKCVFSSEIDQFSKYTYYKNFGVIPFGDITKIKEEDIPNHDILCAGFPCQPFSSIGKREGFSHSTQGTMFYEILRIAKYKKPKILFLENVAGLLHHDQGKTLQIIISSLEELNYSVSYSVLDSSDFGVPQRRKRFYLVASLDHSCNFIFPSPLIDKDINIGDFIESDVKGFDISTYLQKSYLFKKNDGKPILIDRNSKGPVNTLVASYYKIQRLTGTFVRDGTTGVRLLTDSECKAIMGFPSSFILPVSRTQMYKQMGNSVTIPVIESIASEIKKIFVL